MNNQDYFNIKNILPYDKTFNLVIGGRGCGKTYSTKVFVLTEFLKNGSTFVWLRNSEDEVKKLCSNNFFNFFADIKNNEKIKEIQKIEKNKNHLNINGKLAGQFLSLSEFAKIKGNSYSNTFLIFDEFIEEKNQRRYYDRVYAFKSVLESIFRLRQNYKIIMLSNAITRSDLILNLFNFNFKTHGVYQSRQKDAVLFFLANTENFERAKKSTPISKLESQEATALDSNNFENQGWLLKEDILKKTPLLSFECIGHTGVMYSYEDGLFFQIENRKVKNHYTLTVTPQGEFADKNVIEFLKENYIKKNIKFRDYTALGVFLYFIQ